MKLAPAHQLLILTGSPVSAVLRYDGKRYQLLASKSLGNSPSNMQQFVFIYR